MTAVRQLITGYRQALVVVVVVVVVVLITGYRQAIVFVVLITITITNESSLTRESAAFLLRSADELEHLLQIQPKL